MSAIPNGDFIIHYDQVKIDILQTMMYKTNIQKKILHFKQPAGTSRGVYTTRTIWLLSITSDELPGKIGIGECAPLPDLSYDASDDYEERLKELCLLFEQHGRIDYAMMRPYPSALFGLETALLNLKNGDTLFDTPFSLGNKGIPINGLVWMGSFDEMNRRIESKLAEGFHCIKLKIGAIDFDSEMALIRSIRKRFSRSDIELRLDSNGGFGVDEVMWRLEELSRYEIHSIEQPIRQKQWREMAYLCANTPMPIALDEELIGINNPEEKDELLDRIKPQFIVLKPTLHGGMYNTREWVKKSSRRNIGSWITSALESSIGLMAIAQLTSDIYGNDITMAQGLGTGGLFTDNLPPMTEIRGDRLWMKKDR